MTTTLLSFLTMIMAALWMSWLLDIEVRGGTRRLKRLGRDLARDQGVCLVEGLDFGLAEVDAASELADDDEVGCPSRRWA